MKIVINGVEVEAGVSYSAGDGIRIESNAISVETPVKYVTKAEYSALTEEEKQADVLYVVEEPPWMPIPWSIQEYDTDDGWYVRKWSNGYIEMFGKHEYTIPVSMWSNWGGTDLVEFNTTPRYNYPVELVTRYQETVSCTGNFGAMVLSGMSEDPTKKTNKFGLCRGVRPQSEMTAEINHFVTGRWK